VRVSETDSERFETIRAQGIFGVPVNDADVELVRRVVWANYGVVRFDSPRGRHLSDVPELAHAFDTRFLGLDYVVDHDDQVVAVDLRWFPASERDSWLLVWEVDAEGPLANRAVQRFSRAWAANATELVCQADVVDVAVGDVIGEAPVRTDTPWTVAPWSHAAVAYDIAGRCAKIIADMCADVLVMPGRSTQPGDSNLLYVRDRP